MPNSLSEEQYMTIVTHCLITLLIVRLVAYYNDYDSDRSCLIVFIITASYICGPVATTTISAVHRQKNMYLLNCNRQVFPVLNN